MISYSDLCLLNNDIEENIQKLILGGADCIELIMDGDFWKDINCAITKLSDSITEYNVKFSIHPPAENTNLTSLDKLISKKTLEDHKKAILFASLINAKYVVIHPGFLYCDSFNKEMLKKVAKNKLIELNEMAKPLNVKLAVENVGVNGTSLFTEEEFVGFLDEMDDNVGYVIDTGHAHVNGWDIKELISKTEEKLISMHLHDNYGEKDEHNPIGQGTIAWTSILEAIKNSKFNFDLVLEYKNGTKIELIKKHKEMILDTLKK